ncbi:MAG: hypothetical protein HYU39_00935 [Thaumarchaeota archaeon]|nr:hypothetical protein [Nitrososphaerota archaeon]
MTGSSRGKDSSTEKPRIETTPFPNLILKIQAAARRGSSTLQEMKEVDTYVQQNLEAIADNLSGKIEAIRKYSSLDTDKENILALESAIHQLANNLKQKKDVYAELVDRKYRINPHRLNRLLDTEAELFTTLAAVEKSLSRYSKAGAAPKYKLNDFLDAIGEALRLLERRLRISNTNR